ncbi:MAG: dihydrolipoyl dehydrogenase, partial [Candidatus Aminicenantia bacterium]
IGGTCLNYGCIPTKALLYPAKILEIIKNSEEFGIKMDNFSLDWPKIQQRKQKIVDQLVRGVNFLLKKSGVEVIEGKAALENNHMVVVSNDKEKKILEAENIILATGSRPADLPFLKPDGKQIITSKEALELEKIPESMAVIGGGGVGLEIGLIYHYFGTKISIIEILPTILPGNDLELVLNLERILKKEGIFIFTHTRLNKAEVKDNKIKLEAISLENNQTLSLEIEKVLIAVGRKPNSENSGLEKVGIALDNYGFVKVDSRLKTNIPNIYAIGDLIGGKLMAHKASHEGIVAVENICGLHTKIDYLSLPAAVFTEPEFSTVGLTEEQAREKGINIKIGRFPFRANGRALTLAQTDGLIKIISNENEEIIGAHILGPQASELISELSLAISNRLKTKDISKNIHIHPTLSEVIWEANLNVDKKSIHIIN